MELLEFLNNYKYLKGGFKTNQYQLKPNEFKLAPASVPVLNQLLDLLDASDLNTIIRTKSGGIASGKAKYNNSYAWDIGCSHTGVRITILIGAKNWVFKCCQFSKAEKKQGVYPDQAFGIFKLKCLKYGINLDDYKIDNGYEVKQTIQSPMIGTTAFTELNKEYEHVHHIDFNSSHPSGLAIKHPEFTPVIEELMEEKRNGDPIAKAIMVETFGMMQSWHPESSKFAEWAHLSRDMIADTNKRMTELMIKLIASGRKPLLLRTDGIWYEGNIYKGEGEGTGIGEWKHDYIDCKLRIKSKGAYEFICNNEYHPVMSGKSTYDIAEPDRTKWKWGDIYKGQIIKIKFNRITRRFEYEENL